MKAQTPPWIVGLALLEFSVSVSAFAPAPTAQVSGQTSLAASSASATPSTAAAAQGVRIPLKRNASHLRKRDTNAVASWAKRERSRLLGRYGPQDGEEEAADEDGELQPLKRRQEQAGWYSGGYYSASASAQATSTRSSITFRPETTGGIGQTELTNYLADLEYYAPVQVGDPAENFSVILDTGSSDFWLASTGCGTDACGHVPRYNTSGSNSSHSLGNEFSIKYGDGKAAGTMYNDTVTLAGLNASTSFAACDSVSEDMITGNVSGIMGLGFEALAASETTPFWQSLINHSVTDQALLSNGSANVSDLGPFHNLSFPGFSFALTRYINLSHPDDAAPGGIFTLGTLSNESYSGNITYVDIPSDELSYWYIPMDSIQLNSTNVTGINQPNVAIDTGTTLIGGPSKAVASLYSLIPGAKEAADDYTGYWTYPCNETFSVSFGFGGRQFNMTDEDFNLGVFQDATNTSAAQCLGAFFELSLSQGTSEVISWVIGSAFLKNVYSVYRLSPNVSVGFADLNEESLSQYYPESPQPASTEHVKGGAGPFGVPSAPSGSGSAISATARRDSASEDVSAATSSVARSVAASLLLGSVFAVVVQYTV